MITPEELFDSFNRSKIDDRYENRINALKAREFNTEIIENGVNQAIDVIQEKKGNSFVIYGEPQSGKTEFMIALSCKLMDEGYETVFVLMNDNTELENQNFNRFWTSGPRTGIPTGGGGWGCVWGVCVGGAFFPLIF